MCVQNVWGENVCRITLLEIVVVIYPDFPLALLVLGLSLLQLLLLLLLLVLLGSFFLLRLRSVAIGPPREDDVPAHVTGEQRAEEANFGCGLVVWGWR